MTLPQGDANPNPLSPAVANALLDTLTSSAEAYRFESFPIPTLSLRSSLANDDRWLSCAILAGSSRPRCLLCLPFVFYPWGEDCPQSAMLRNCGMSGPYHVAPLIPPVYLECQSNLG